MEALRVFMVKYNNHVALFAILTWIIPSYQTIASVNLDTVGTSFIATITDGSCDVSFDNKAITFMPRMASEFNPGVTVEVKPISAQMNCTYAVTPQVTISGTTYSSNNRVFLNKNPDWPEQTNGVGFMVQPASTVIERDKTPSLDSFYANGMGGKAISATTPMSLIPLSEDNDFSVNQVLWVGLVGLVDSNQIIPGRFSANLTININLP